MKKITLILAVLLLPVLCTSIEASTEAYVNEGNNLYKQEKYDEAKEQYKKAKELSPDSDIVNFNLGAALYKQGRYEEAAAAIAKSLSTDNRELEAQAVYNLGNINYKQGSQAEGSDMNSAIAKYRDALDYYKRAIELDEKDRDARYNHELAEKKIKVLMDQQKNQQQKQDQKQDDHTGQDEGQQNAGTDGEEGKDHKESGQQAGKEGNDNESGESSAESNEDSASTGDESISNEGSESSGSKGKEMTPEEARMLLNAYGQEEELKKTKKRAPGRVLRDW